MCKYVYMYVCMYINSYVYIHISNYILYTFLVLIRHIVRHQLLDMCHAIVEREREREREHRHFFFLSLTDVWAKPRTPFFLKNAGLWLSAGNIYIEICMFGPWLTSEQLTQTGSMYGEIWTNWHFDSGHEIPRFLGLESKWNCLLITIIYIDNSWRAAAQGFSHAP